MTQIQHLFCEWTKAKVGTGRSTNVILNSVGQAGGPLPVTGVDWRRLTGTNADRGPAMADAMPIIVWTGYGAPQPSRQLCM